MTLLEAIARRTKKLMQEKNISQSMLETKSTIHHKIMNKLLECKYKDLDARLIFKLCKGFDISVDMFFNDELFNFANIEIKK